MVIASPLLILEHGMVCLMTMFILIALMKLRKLLFPIFSYMPCIRAVKLKKFVFIKIDAQGLSYQSLSGGSEILNDVFGIMIKASY